MPHRVLHVLSQRPGRTGSGVTLRALVHEAAKAGWMQEAVVGTPIDDPGPEVGDLPARSVHPLHFGTPPLDWPLPGMSDVMPYESSRWQDLSDGQLEAYRSAWRRHLAGVLHKFQPDVIHVHHMWVLGSIIKDVAPDTPVVMHTHATGLRQMELCPHLADEVRSGCVRNERFLVLTEDLARRYEAALGIGPDRVDVIGAGYRDDCFHDRGRGPETCTDVVYVGKYSRAKGLPWLLDAWERVAAKEPDRRLHVVGGRGGGHEAEALRVRMEAMAPGVVVHGHMEQPELAQVMRQCGVFVLPSFYEGLPLVVVEAIACRCRAVVTGLPTVREELVAHLGDAIEIVDMPRLRGIDEPEPEDLPRFVDDLERALMKACAEGALEERLPALQRFTWRETFQRVEAAWHAAMNAQGP